MQQNDVLDLHLTRLVGWLVQTVGKALLVGAVVGVLVGLWSAPLGAAAGGLVVAAYLATSKAPMPIEVEGD